MLLVENPSNGVMGTFLCVSLRKGAQRGAKRRKEKSLNCFAFLASFAFNAFLRNNNQ
jgi:hypothetical protein